MADYASNAKANTAITLASVLGGIGTLNALGGNCGNGLGNILGLGNCQGGAVANAQVAGILAENGQLKAEKYADGVGKDVYIQTERNTKDLRTEFYAYIKPIADAVVAGQVENARLQEQIKCCCEKGELQDKLTRAELRGEIKDVANTAACGISQLGQAVQGLREVVSQVTQLVIPIDKVCPQPMPLNNTWAAPTSTAPTSVQLTAGSAKVA